MYVCVRNVLFCSIPFVSISQRAPANLASLQVCKCKFRHYYLFLNRFESTRPVLSRHIPYIPEISRYFPLNGSVKAQKNTRTHKSPDAYKGNYSDGVLFRIAVSKVFLAVAVTCWHSQPYQFVIHGGRIRRQHYLALLLQLFQVRTYLRNLLIGN